MGGQQAQLDFTGITSFGEFQFRSRVVERQGSAILRRYELDKLAAFRTTKGYFEDCDASRTALRDSAFKCKSRCGNGISISYFRNVRSIAKFTLLRICGCSLGSRIHTRISKFIADSPNPPKCTTGFGCFSSSLTDSAASSRACDTLSRSVL